eukprot:TRINITY_DN7859_c0_g1_i1.p1 TRINITY_DN7859_c0_g1~~TRINITY_DN7859_c0_g1_i1.p1  ORF type:complete len:671 (+),score=118.59 TRINITY_DN7859_c0_g1_i1:90-2102(+)
MLKAWYRQISISKSQYRFNHINHDHFKYQEYYEHSINDPASFWSKQAQHVDWFKKWDTALEKALPDPSDPCYTWFKGGVTNLCHNVLDRHISERKDQKALIYDSPVTKTLETYTYSELLERVRYFAGVLSSLGVSKGDRVVIYMPMIPEAAIAMYACSRIGAIHSVVFGGFPPEQLAQRINHAEPKVIISATCGFNKYQVTPFVPLLRKAIELAKHKPDHVIIKQRPELKEKLLPNEIDFETAISSEHPFNECVPLSSNDPLYILYTSGTTGDPKGIVRDTGGYMVSLLWSMRNIFGIDRGDVMFSASDIGWVVGHSYIVHGPLLAGGTTVMFEGKPVGTPDPGVFFRIIQQHKVNKFFTAPTAFRALKKEDPNGKYIHKYDLSSLKTIYLAGERTDPDTLLWGQEVTKKPIIDNWWQTESGWPMSSNFSPIGSLHPQFPSKPGSVTKPVPGWNIQVVDSEGKQVSPNTLGFVVTKLPLPPGAFGTLYKNKERYIKAYFSEFPGYYNTGDAGLIDSDGYLSIMTRTDDIINVSGIRLSTGAIEEVISQHPAVAECAVIGPDDEFRGQVPVGFVVLKETSFSSNEDQQLHIINEIIKMVRDKVGSVAYFKKIAIVPFLPKTRSGKILRVVLKNMANGKPANPPGTIEDMSALDHAYHALIKLGFKPIHLRM